MLDKLIRSSGFNEKSIICQNIKCYTYLLAKAISIYYLSIYFAQKGRTFPSTGTTTQIFLAGLVTNQNKSKLLYIVGNLEHFLAIPKHSQAISRTLSLLCTFVPLHPGTPGSPGGPVVPGSP